ncbi:MAG: type II secretion system F family protein [Gammaproteobacteria bacterium]
MPIELQTSPAAPASARRSSDKPARKPARRFGSGAKLGARDRMAFTEQLALLLATGMPLHNSLQAMGKQAGNPAMRQVIADLSAEIESGQRFAAALGKHPELFSTTYVNLVAASEGSGFLPKVLEQLLAEEEKREELRKTVVSAMTYPAFLMGFSVLVVIFVLVFVFPKFADMFARIHDQLPATTIVLMWFSGFLRTYWWQVLAVVGAGGMLLVRGIKSPAGTALIDDWKLRIPVVSGVFVQLYVTQSFRVLSLSLTHGVSIVDALEAARDVVSNYRFRGLMARVERSVQDGGTIAAGFAESPFIPDLVKEMVTTAEASGNLAMVMGRVAEHYERELSRRLVALSKMAEPVMLLVMGVVVGVIVSSLILPIFKLSKAVT